VRALPLVPHVHPRFGHRVRPYNKNPVTRSGRDVIPTGEAAEGRQYGRVPPEPKAGKAEAGAVIVAQPADPDPDKDGVIGTADQCPTENGGTNADGCPTRDKDGDGIADANDKCVDQAETVNKFEDEDGCPDTIPDTDADGFIACDDLMPQKARILLMLALTVTRERGAIQRMFYEL
jgi:hypothetical protein